MDAAREGLTEQPDADADPVAVEPQGDGVEFPQPAEYPAVVAYLLAVVAKLTRERDEALAKNAERWLPLKVAAIDAAVEYETARTWAARGLIKARRDGGRVFVELSSLIARRMLFAGK